MITAVWAHSVVDGWGYAVFLRGAPIRRHSGAEGEICIDDGPRLPIEEKLIGKLEKIEQAGLIYYRDPNYPEGDDMTEADLGNYLTPKIASFYAGKDILELDAPGANFWLNDREAQFLTAQTQTQLKTPERPWWAFWR